MSLGLLLLATMLITPVTSYAAIGPSLARSGGSMTEQLILRGYPGTPPQRHGSLPQHPGGNARQDDRLGRAS